MALVQRSITVPNHNEIMGLSGTANQTTFNNFCKDVHQVLIDVGLTPLDLSDDIDFNNIADLGIGAIVQNTDLNYNSFVSAGSKYYAFNDDSQNEYPVIMKFTYGLSCVSAVGVTNYMWTAIKLDLIRNLETEDKIYPTKILTNISSTTHISPSYNRISDSILSNVVTCFYNKNNFYLNIFPKSRCVSRYATLNNVKYSTYIGFYFDRQENITNFMQLNYGIYISNASDINLTSAKQNLQINNILNNIVIISDNTPITIPLISFVDNINNNYQEGGINSLGFKTILYDKSTKTISPNYNILSAYNAQIAQSNVRYEIELDDGTIGKYISYSVSDNINYFPDLKTDFLFRYE